MLKQSFLGGLVVVGSNEEGSGGTIGFGFLGQFHGLAGRIGTRASNDETAPRTVLDGEFDDALMLFVVERWRLPGGSAWDDAGDACGKLGIDQFFEGRFVEGAVAKWGDESGVGACEHDVGRG